MKILVLFYFCLLNYGCYFFENIKSEYPDWESLMNAPENKKGWFPPLLNINNLFLENNIFNIIIINNIDTNNVWGKFNYSNVFINDLPIQINPYKNNFEMIDRGKNRCVN